MKKGGQKAKANAHQRAVAKIFTEAYYPDGDGEFRSTPGSGGWDKRIAPGDVIAFKKIAPVHGHTGMTPEPDFAIDNTFPLSIECKDWRDENVKHFFSGLYSEESQIFDWMRQSLADASCVNKTPIVVFKLFRTENIVILLSHDFVRLADLFGNFGKKFYTINSVPEKAVYHMRLELTLMLLKDFIEWIDWYVFKVGNEHKYIKSLMEKK